MPLTRCPIWKRCYQSILAILGDKKKIFKAGSACRRAFALNVFHRRAGAVERIVKV